MSGKISLGMRLLVALRPNVWEDKPGNEATCSTPS